MQAVDLDFARVQYFAPEEFPSLATADGELSILTFLEAGVVRALDRFRGRLGEAVVPSPRAGGWIREGGSPTSRHYVGPIRRDEDGTLQAQRLATAADVFPHGDIRHAFMIALGMPEFGGIGVYLDTRLEGRPAPMLHLDLRITTRQLWLRDADGYLYPGRGETEMRRFFRKLATW